MAELEAVPSVPDRWEAVHSRPDVILRDGVLHLANASLTPAEATEADLLHLADALAAAGVRTVLARTAAGRPILAVDAADRELAVGAVTRAAAGEPLYAKAAGSRPVLVADAGLPLAEGVSAVTLFRPRLEPRGGLRYGAAEGVRLETWRFGEALVETPAQNALLRRLTPRADLALATVERHGRTWTTVAGMFARHPGEFAADVDMVFSWVDGSSSEFQRARARRMAEYVVGDGDDSSARFRHVDELRYALRSVHMFAPWVRRIFIATDS